MRIGIDLVHGGRRETPSNTIGDLRYPLVARVVLSATANGIGKAMRFDATDKHLIFGRLSGGC